MACEASEELGKWERRKRGSERVRERHGHGERCGGERERERASERASERERAAERRIGLVRTAN